MTIEFVIYNVYDIRLIKYLWNTVYDICLIGTPFMIFVWGHVQRYLTKNMFINIDLPYDQDICLWKQSGVIICLCSRPLIRLELNSFYKSMIVKLMCSKRIKRREHPCVSLCSWNFSNIMFMELFDKISMELVWGIGLK